MPRAVKNVFIVGAKRTPFGLIGGKLKEWTATELGVVSSVAAIQQSKLPAEIIDQAIFGNVIPSSLGSSLVSRHIALRSGMKQSSTALTVNTLDGSGFESLIVGSEQICLGNAKAVLCGGTESLSNAPFYIFGQIFRFGVQKDTFNNVEDSLWGYYYDPTTQSSLGSVMEKSAEMDKVSRLESDQLAYLSHVRADKAHVKGWLKNEIVPLLLKPKKDVQIEFVQDEFVIQEIVRRGFAIKPLFLNNGIITAGNMGVLGDGAASLVICDDEIVRSHALEPLARVVAWHHFACEETKVAHSTIHLINELLAETGLSLDEIDLFEINELFANQVVITEKRLNLDHTKVNVNGGAIAMGHPIAASGARILGHLAYELVRRKKRMGLGLTITTGGQAVAVLLENAQLS